MFSKNLGTVNLGLTNFILIKPISTMIVVTFYLYFKSSNYHIVDSHFNSVVSHFSFSYIYSLENICSVYIISVIKNAAFLNK